LAGDEINDYGKDFTSQISGVPYPCGLTSLGVEKTFLGGKRRLFVKKIIDIFLQLCKILSKFEESLLNALDLLAITNPLAKEVILLSAVPE
jgi:hypothetical protein